MIRQFILFGTIITFLGFSGPTIAQTFSPSGGFEPAPTFPAPSPSPVPAPSPSPEPDPYPTQTERQTEIPPEVLEELQKRGLPDTVQPKIIVPALEALPGRPDDWREIVRKYKLSPTPPKAPPTDSIAPVVPGTSYVERRVDPVEGGQVVREKHPDVDFPTATIVTVAVESGAIDSQVDQVPEGGWEAQYKRCRQSQRRDASDPRGLELDRIVNRLQLEATNIDPYAALRNATEQDRLEFFQSVREYDAACLTDPKDIPPPPPEIGMLAGVFTFPYGPFCAGYLVNRFTVVTARHCFFEKSGLLRQEFDPTNNDIQFHVTGDSQGTGFPARHIQENFWYVRKTPPAETKSQYDYLFIVIDPVPFDPPALPFTGVDPGDQIVIYSFNRLVYLADYLAILTTSDTPPTRVSFGTSLRWDRSPTCFAFALGYGNCIYHLCQTAGGYSGAPIFRFNKNRQQFEFAGIHISAMNDAGTCSDSRYKGMGNIGIMLGKDVETASTSASWATLVEQLQRQ